MIPIHATNGLQKWEAAVLLDNAAGRHTHCLNTAGLIAGFTSNFWAPLGVFLIPPSVGLGTAFLCVGLITAAPMYLTLSPPQFKTSGVHRMNRGEGIAAPYITQLSNVKFQLLRKYGEETPLDEGDIRLLWRVVDKSARHHLVMALNLNQLAALHHHLGEGVFNPFLRGDLPTHTSWRALNQRFAPHHPPALLVAALITPELRAHLKQNPSLFSHIQRSLSDLEDPLLQQTLADLEREIRPVRGAPVVRVAPPNRDRRVRLDNRDLVIELCSYLRSPEILRICSVCKSWQQAIYRGFQNPLKEARKLWTWMNRVGQLSYLNKAAIDCSSLHFDVMGFADGRVCIYTSEPDGTFHTKQEWVAHVGQVTCIQKLDTAIATASLDGRIKIWSETGELQATFEPPIPVPVPIRSLAVDSEHVCSSTDHHLFVWDRSTGDLVRSIPLGALGAMPALLKQGSLLFGRKGGLIYRWDIATGGALPPLRGRTLEFEEERAFPLDLEASTSLFQMSEQELIAKGAGNSIRIWDLATGREKRHILFPSGTTPLGLPRRTLTSLTVQRDFIFGGFADGGVRSWDRVSGKELPLLQPDWGILKPQHQAPIVAIHLDGANVITQDATGVTIKLKFDNTRPRLKSLGARVERLIDDVAESTARVIVWVAKEYWRRVTLPFKEPPRFS